MTAAATDSNRLGTTVAGRYRLRRVLGRGGMGIVYEAEDETSHRRLAIKVMHPENQVSTDNVRRFMNEAHAAGRVQHPNIVEVFDAGEDAEDGSLYIALELLTGIDLATYLTRYDRLMPSETLTVVCQVLQALIVAHGAGVVHRDIKPENIFLARLPTGETHVKIVDFGISKVLNPEKDIDLRITQSNTTVGTPHYMSPEQAKGESIDPRADIWALGVVMYECLTGQLPFDGDNFNLQIVAVVTEAHKPASDYEVEPDLSAIVDRCLQKDRKKRFASAMEMLEDLKRYLDEHPETAVRQSLLLAPAAHELAPIERARPNDPTGPMPTVKGPEAIEAASEKEGESQKSGEFPGQDTIDQLPVFPGMVPIDEETPADSMPTTVRAIVPGGAAPKPISQRPGAYKSDPPPKGGLQLGPPRKKDLPELPKRASLAAPPMPKDLLPPTEIEGDASGPVADPLRIPRPPAVPSLGFTPIESEPVPPVDTDADTTGNSLAAPGRRSRVFLIAAAMGLTAAIGGAALSRLHARPAATVRTVRVRFTRMMPEAQPVVGGVRYFSNEAYVARGVTPVVIRIEAPGYETLSFAITPERDQDVVLPPMVRASATPAVPVVPATPTPSAAPTPSATSDAGARPSARTALTLPTTIAPELGEQGQVSVGATPRCQVFIDGQDVGPTPVYHRSVHAGVHRVRCVREEGVSPERAVVVNGGAHERVVFDATE